jgi:hypothetical protein
VLDLVLLLESFINLGSDYANVESAYVFVAFGRAYLLMVVGDDRFEVEF